MYWYGPPLPQILHHQPDAPLSPGEAESCNLPFHIQGSRSMPLTRLTEGLSAPLASLLYRILRLDKNYQTFILSGQKLWLSLLGRGTFSRTIFNRYLLLVLVPPNLCFGASRGSRTLVYCLEGSHNSRYTIPAFHCSFLFLTYILQQKFHRKSNSYYGGKWQNRTAMSRATTCRFSISLTTQIFKARFAYGFEPFRFLFERNCYPLTIALLLLYVPFCLLVDPVGVEPTTFRLQGGCSPKTEL